MTIFPLDRHGVQVAPKDYAPEGTDVVEKDRQTDAPLCDDTVFGLGVRKSRFSGAEKPGKWSI